MLPLLAPVVFGLDLGIEGHGVVDKLGLVCVIGHHHTTNIVSHGHRWASPCFT